MLTSFWLFSIAHNPSPRKTPNCWSKEQSGRPLWWRTRRISPVPRPVFSVLSCRGCGLPQLQARESETLRNEILRHIGGETGAQAETGFVTSLRHQSLIREATAALDAAQAAVRGKIPHEMILLDLYNALRQLDEITGATATDDILNLIFSTFCIGK